MVFFKIKMNDESNNGTIILIKQSVKKWYAYTNTSVALYSVYL